MLLTGNPEVPQRLLQSPVMQSEFSDHNSTSAEQ